MPQDGQQECFPPAAHIFGQSTLKIVQSRQQHLRVFVQAGSGLIIGQVIRGQIPIGLKSSTPVIGPSYRIERVKKLV